MAAIIAAGVSVVGWFAVIYRDRANDRRRRFSRAFDIQTALRAEINHYVEALKSDQLETAWERITDKIKKEGRTKYIPFIPEERNDVVFQELIPDLSLLPQDVVEPIVDYYNQVFAISAMISDLRSDRYPTLTRQQRLEMYTDYMAMKNQALKKGRATLRVLDARLKAQRKRAAGMFSNLGVARYDRL